MSDELRSEAKSIVRPVIKKSWLLWAISEQKILAVIGTDQRGMLEEGDSLNGNGLEVAKRYRKHDFTEQIGRPTDIPLQICNPSLQ